MVGGSPGSIWLPLLSESVSLGVCPPLLCIHYGSTLPLMETLESFTSPPSIMSFKLFPYFLFLTSPLFPPPQLHAFSAKSRPPSFICSPPPTPPTLHHLTPAPVHIISPNSLSQAISLGQRLPGRPPSPPPPFLTLSFLASLVSCHLLVLLRMSGAITLTPPDQSRTFTPSPMFFSVAHGPPFIPLSLSLFFLMFPALENYKRIVRFAAKSFGFSPLLDKNM